MIHTLAPSAAGPLLRRLRLNRRQTLGDVAACVRCRPATLRRLEEGSLDASMQRIIDLFEHYGCGVKIEVYEPPDVATLGEMIEALQELGYEVKT